ncbi:MAG: YCF48-related protein [Caldilineaceae bacterium]
MQMKRSWQRLGAWTGGTVAAVALSPRFVSDHLALAATAAGVYRSTGGATWTLATAGLSDPNCVALAFAEQPHQQAPQAFVATGSGRLFTSHNGGQPWTEVASWAGLGVITAFALSPNFAEDQTLFVATAEGVFRSQDGGQSWESSTFGLLDLEILCLACAPDFAQSEVLWAGTVQGGFYRSRNAGRSWRDAGLGLPDAAIQCLVASPNFASDQTLWVGAETAGIYRSVDGGLSWEAVSTELAKQSINCLAVTPTGDCLLAGTSAGVYWSDDGGDQWQASENGAFAALSFGVSASGVALAGAALEGCYLSTNQGKSWQPTGSELAAHAPPVVVRSSAGEFFALDSDGQLAYAQEGRHWQTFAMPSDQTLAAFTIAGEAEATKLYAITSEGQLYNTQVHGEWQACLTDLVTEKKLTLLTPSPTFAQDQTLALADEEGQVYLWRTNETEIRTASMPWPGEALLQLAFSPHYSVDQTLCTVTAQLDAQANYRIQLWHSSDDGQQWTNLAELHTEIPAVVLAWPDDPQEQAIFLGTQNRVIKIFMRAPDQQLAVEQTFFDEAISITALAVSPTYAQDKMLFAASNRGVFCSEDGGATWTLLGTGLDERVVVALFPDGRGGLQAVTLGGAVWQMERLKS